MKEGSGMFGYSLPIKPARIRRILHLPPGSGNGVLERAISELYKAAFENPKLNREQMANIVQHMRGPEEDQVKNKRSSRKKRRR